MVVNANNESSAYGSSEPPMVRRAISSAVERPLDMGEATGSIPVSPTIELTAEYLRERLHYDPLTGRFFWKLPPNQMSEWTLREPTPRWMDLPPSPSQEKEPT